MSYIEVSEDSDVIFIDTCRKTKVKKKVEDKARRKVMMCTEKNMETIRCETLVKLRRRPKVTVPSRRERLQELIRSLVVPRSRIVPCCMRKHCKKKRCKRNETRLVQTHTRRRRHRKHRKRSSFHNKAPKNIYERNSISLYESISSDSFYSSDNGLDELIRSTKKRMQDQFPKDSPPVLKASTPDTLDLDSTFELNSIHSLETVRINKNHDFSPILSPTSSETFRIERNNNIGNMYEGMHGRVEVYSPSMHLDLDRNYNYDCLWSPISDGCIEFLCNVNKT